MRTTIGKPADRWASAAIAPGFLAAFSVAWLGVMLVVRPGNVGITPLSVLTGCVLLPLLVVGLLVPTLALRFRAVLAAATARRRDQRRGTFWLGARLGLAAAAAAAAASSTAEAVASSAGLPWTRISLVILAAFFAAAIAGPVALLWVLTGRDRRRTPVR